MPHYGKTHDQYNNNLNEGILWPNKSTCGYNNNLKEGYLKALYK